MDDHADSPARRFRTVLDLHRFGVKMMRQNLRRRHPKASEREIDAILDSWMRRQGAEYGVPQAEPSSSG